MFFKNYFNYFHSINLFFSKISENFSSYHDCLSTVAGRMLFQKGQ